MWNFIDICSEGASEWRIWFVANGNERNFSLLNRRYRATFDVVANTARTSANFRDRLERARGKRLLNDYTILCAQFNEFHIVSFARASPRERRTSDRWLRNEWYLLFIAVYSPKRMYQNKQFRLSFGPCTRTACKWLLAFNRLLFPKTW